MTHAGCYIAGVFAVNRVKKLGYAAVAPGGFTEAEKPPADFVYVFAVGIKARGGYPAVARNERADALANKRLKVFKRLLFYGVPVVMRMCVDKARGEGKTRKVNRLCIRIRRCDFRADLGNFVLLYENVAEKRLCASSVVDFGVF